MTQQSPSPFQPPQGPLGFDYYRPMRNPLAPARRAGIFMYLLAALTLLCGTGLIAAGSIVDWQALWQRALEMYGPDFAAQMKSQGATSEQLRASAFVWGGVGLALGIALVPLGIFVARGSRGAIVTSMILVSLILFGTLCSAALGTLAAVRAGPAGLFGGCIFLLPLLLSMAALFLLIVAARATSNVRMAQQYAHAQWLHAQQQQQQPSPPQAPGGYGYGAHGILPSQAGLQPPPAPPGQTGPTMPPRTGGPDRPSSA